MNKALLLLLGIFFYLNLTGSAQVLNVEERRLIDELDTNKMFKTSFDIGFQYIQNTKDFLNLKLANQIEYKKIKNHDLSVISSLDLVKNGSETIINSGIVYLKDDIKTENEKLFIELIAQTQRNKVYFVQNRTLYSAGIRYNILKDYLKRMSFGTSLFVEHLNLSDSTEYNNARLNFYLSHQVRVKDFKLSSIIYYQPNILNFSDVRVLFDCSAEMPLYKNITFKANVNYTHDIRNVSVFNFIQSLKVIF